MINYDYYSSAFFFLFFAPSDNHVRGESQSDVVGVEETEAAAFIGCRKRFKEDSDIARSFYGCDFLRILLSMIAGSFDIVVRMIFVFLCFRYVPLDFYALTGTVGR